MTKESRASADTNPTPLTVEPDAPHLPSLGAAGGAVAGADTGAIAGSAGLVTGLVAGAGAGGPCGEAVAKRIKPTFEDAYWRELHTGEPYYEPGRSYDDYRPAYELGWSSRALHAMSKEDFDSIEPELAQGWNARHGNSSLPWERARPATRAAWDRAQSAFLCIRDSDDSTASSEREENKQVVDVLNDFLESMRDAEFGFQTCADEVAAANLQQLFYHRAEQCHQAADELVQLIWRFGGTPGEGGVVKHRGWIPIGGTMGADSDLSMLEECERREDAALARYSQALMQSLPHEVQSFVERQVQAARRNHDRVRALRDEARDTPDQGGGHSENVRQ